MHTGTGCDVDTPGRVVPVLPPEHERLRLAIDSDVANEIDDLYAIALALASPHRFAIEGFVATHFAAAVGAGRESIEASRQTLLELLDVAGAAGRFPVLCGGHPMQYMREPSPSEGASWLIERAMTGPATDPLWIMCLGAATNVASALLQAPEIAPRVRVVFHARSPRTWPERSEQFNVRGDVLAVSALLASDAPLVWFDAGCNLSAPMAMTAERLAPLGPLGAWLHAYRSRRDFFQDPEKGFFDIGDIAWMMRPALASSEVVPAPKMGHDMRFDHGRAHGRMLRVHDMARMPTWDLFFEQLADGDGGRSRLP